MTATIWTRLVSQGLAAAALTSVAFGQPPVVKTGPAPQVEIKKHATGKEATITQGEKEWFIHIDVDDNRTMIIRSESNSGKETKNDSEIVERPMSNTEVDRLIADWVSGIKSTLVP